MCVRQNGSVKESSVISFHTFFFSEGESSKEKRGLLSRVHGEMYPGTTRVHVVLPRVAGFLTGLFTL